jgi:hypothetical protein
MDANSCIDGSTSQRNDHRSVTGYPCHNQGGNQVYL